MNQTARLTIAAGVAAVSVVAAGVVLAQDRTTTIKRVTDASPAAPGLAWSITPSDLGVEGAMFADPRTGSEYSWGVGSIHIDDTLITLAVVPDEYLGNSDAHMIGLDAHTGDKKWSTPAPGLAACSEQPLDGQLVCHRPSYGEQTGLVTFDVETGESREFDTASEIFAATVANERLYVAEGDLEGAEVTLHRGTLEDFDADWSEPIYVWAGWEDQYADQLKVGSEVGYFDLGGGFATFDAVTGRETWSTDVLDDCLTAQYRTAGDLAIASTDECGSTSGEVTGTTAFTRDGDVLASREGPAVHSLSIDQPSDISIPVVLGDAAFDRTTGEQLWQNDLLAFDYPGDEYNEPRTQGTLTAVIGDVGLLGFDGSTIGIDLRTGEQLWRTAETRSLIGTDADTVIFSSGSELGAVDVRTGSVLWTLEPSKLAPDADSSLDTFVEGSGGSYLLQSGSTVVKLEPLP